MTGFEDVMKELFGDKVVNRKDLMQILFTNMQAKRKNALDQLYLEQNAMFKVSEENRSLRKTLKEIAKYETCWTCKYYIGSMDKYCNPPEMCNNKRSQFKPNERSKRLALEALEGIDAARATTNWFCTVCSFKNISVDVSNPEVVCCGCNTSFKMADQ